MDNQNPRALLLLFRRGLDDDEPQFREALASAAGDPELNAWLERETAVHQALQGKFREIEVPDDLLQKIALQNAAPGMNAGRYFQLAAVLTILCGLAIFWFRPAPRKTFMAYERYLGSLVSHPYRMSLETSNLDKIRTFLANNQAPADYVISRRLARANPLGCATLSWNGNPVSMLCFADAGGRKVFLFVTNRRAVPDAPGGEVRQVQHVGDFAVAGWTEGEQSYVLAVQGDRGALEGYLPGQG